MKTLLEEEGVKITEQTLTVHLGSWQIDAIQSSHITTRRCHLTEHAILYWLAVLALFFGAWELRILSIHFTSILGTAGITLAALLVGFGVQPRQWILSINTGAGPQPILYSRSPEHLQKIQQIIAQACSSS